MMMMMMCVYHILGTALKRPRGGVGDITGVTRQSRLKPTFGEGGIKNIVLQIVTGEVGIV